MRGIKRAWITAMLVCTAVFAVDKPNVIIIFTDDQGYQDLGCFDSPLIDTPRIDRMADEGIRLTDFYVSSSVCSASRASLLTGRKPEHHGVSGVFEPGSDGLNNSEKTIADVLKSTGYITAMFGKWHLGDETDNDLPLAFGFDEYFGIPFSNDMFISPTQDFATNCVFLEGYTLETAQLDQQQDNDGDGKLGVDSKVALLEGNQIVEYPANQATLTKRYFNRAIATIDSVTATNKENPFFIYIAPAMPHVPLYASENFAGTSARGTYGDVLEEIDYHVGELLDHLKSSGLDERTIVIYTSDNGPWLGHGNDTGSSDPYQGGKFSVYEGGVRVPCVMRWPGGWPAGQVSDEILSTVDILPTLAHYAGATLPSVYLAGFDVSHHLENTAVPTGKPYDVVKYSGYNGTANALRKDEWKLMPEGPNGGAAPRLYNVKTDPGEVLNQYSAQAYVAAELESDFADYLETQTALPDQMPPNSPSQGTATPGPRNITLSWPANIEEDLSHYLVYRSLTSGSGYTPLALAKTNSFTDSSPVIDSINYYVVVAVDGRGNKSAFSPEMMGVPSTDLSGYEQKLLEFDFSPVVSNSPSLLDGAVLSAGITSQAGLSRNGLGLSDTSLVDQEWNLATTISHASLEDVLSSTNKLYMGFSVGPATGYEVKITRFQFDLYREGEASPLDYHLFTDRDGFAATNALGMVSLTNTALIEFSVSNLWLALDQPIEARLYMSRNQDATASTHVNGVSVFGIVSDIPPLAPEGLLASSTTPGEVELTWTASVESDISGYNIYRFVQGDSGFELVSKNQASTSFSDRNLTENAVVNYHITAVDDGGHESESGVTTSVAVMETVVANGTINIIGNTTGAVGGEFANYTSLSTGSAWGDSSDNDGLLSLTVSRIGLNGDISSSKWNSSGYTGEGTEIDFTKGSRSAAGIADALAQNCFLAFKLDSTAFDSETFTLDSISASMWRNGDQAADMYQLAYDDEGDGFDAGDFLGSAVAVTNSGSLNAFTVAQSMSTIPSDQHEVRLYFWRTDGAGAVNANTHLFSVTSTYSLDDAGSVGNDAQIDLVGNISGTPGGEFADYSALTDYDAWGDSSDQDNVLDLTVSRIGLNNDESSSKWNNSNYKGAGAEINFTKGSFNAGSVADALAQNAFVAIQLDSRGVGGQTFSLDSVSASMWRNGSEAADVYQFAYDDEGDGYDAGDFLGSAVMNTVSGTVNTFTVFEALETGLSTTHEIRLYFWKQAGNGSDKANTHLYEVSATYVTPSVSGFVTWINQYGGTNAVGSINHDFDGDGMSNFDEYALNGNPTNALNRGQFSHQVEGSSFIFVHGKLLNDSSVTYRLIDSLDLTFTNAAHTNAYLDQSFGQVIGDYQTVSNHYEITSDRMFFKLEIEQ